VFEGSILSSVVPRVTEPLKTALEKLTGKRAMVVGPGIRTGMNLRVDEPGSVAADLIVGGVTASAYYGTPAIVIDMGTATTFDVMKDGGFAGGIIIPGISASLDVLTEKAARLLPVSIKWPKRLIANNTDDAIRAGLLFGFMAELETLVAKIKQEMGKKDVPVFATGGWGRTVVGHTKIIDTYDPYLTLDGVRLVALRGDSAAEVIDKDAEE
jgi:type III pantothenate kinase